MLSTFLRELIHLHVSFLVLSFLDQNINIFLLMSLTSIEVCLLVENSVNGMFTLFSRGGGYLPTLEDFAIFDRKTVSEGG